MSTEKLGELLTVSKLKKSICYDQEIWSWIEEKSARQKFTVGQTINYLLLQLKNSEESLTNSENSISTPKHKKGKHNAKS